MTAPHLPDARTPVVLSAHAEELLATDAGALHDYLQRRPAVADLAAHLTRTRRLRRHRAVVRAHDLDELADGLRALAAGTDHPLLTRAAEPSAPRAAFVCPGQGSQWPAMGADAYRQLPAYRAAADTAAAAFDAAGLTSPLRYLTTEAGPDSFTEIEVQGAQFVHTVALGAVWRDCGVLPDVTIGHSLGEIAAAYLADAITLSDAVAVVAARAGVVDRLPGRYAVAALGITAADAHELIAATPGWLELSVINAEASVAVSGDRDAVAAAVAAVRHRGGFAREITVNFPVHTSVLDPLRGHVENRLPRGAFADTAVQFIGAVTGGVVAAGTDFTDYWYANLRQTVRFDRAVAAAIRCGVGTFVELSTHPALLHAIGEGLGATPALLVGSGRRGEPLTDQLSAGIVAAALADPRYRWSDLHDPAAPALPGVPPAPMRKVHLWAAPDPLPPVSGVTVTTETWQPEPVATPAAPRRIAVIGADDTLADILRRAVDGHPAARTAAAADADILAVVAPAMHQAGIAEAAAAIAGRLDAGLLDYADAVGPDCRQVWLVTAGGEKVTAADPVARPAQAALAAMHRATGFEHPDQSFSHLDVPTRDLDAPAATAAVEVLLTGAGETALRGTTAYRRTLGDPAPVAPAWPLDSGVLDHVVITGGAGAIGLQYAHDLAERGARRIVLLSRRAADADTLTALRGRFGTDIVSVPCDLTDRDRVARAAAEHAGDGATLIVHAAGAATFQSRDRLDGATFAGTCAAKVAGLEHLLDVWPLRPEVRILLCSSVIGVWGGRGTAAYAAANRMLDVAAERLRSDGVRAVSVRWGLWDTADGRPGLIDAAETERVQRSGLRPMPPRAAIEAGLYDFGADPLILAADPDRLAVFFGAQRPAVPTAAAPDPTGTADPADAVRRELAAVLNAPDAAALDLETSLFDLGVDSLLALDLRKRLQRSTGATVKLATLLSGITAAELIADLTCRDTPESGYPE